MDIFHFYDYITCNTEKIRDMILESLENTGLSVVVSPKCEGKFYLEVIEKSQ